MCDDPKKHPELSRENRRKSFIAGMMKAKAPASVMQEFLEIFDAVEDAKEELKLAFPSWPPSIEHPEVGHSALTLAAAHGTATPIQQKMLGYIMNDLLAERVSKANPLDSLLEALGISGNAQVKVINMGDIKDDLPPFMKPLPKKETLH